MKNAFRLATVLTAGLFLTGCETTNTTETKPKSSATALGDKPLSSSDHFRLREDDMREQRARGTP